MFSRTHLDLLPDMTEPSYPDDFRLHPTYKRLLPQLPGY